MAAFLPSLIAWKREHQNAGAIAILNVTPFLALLPAIISGIIGLLMWFVALVRSATAVRKRPWIAEAASGDGSRWRTPRP